MGHLGRRIYKRGSYLVTHRGYRQVALLITSWGALQRKPPFSWIPQLLLHYPQELLERKAKESGELHLFFCTF